MSDYRAKLYSDNFKDLKKNTATEEENFEGYVLNYKPVGA